MKYLLDTDICIYLIRQKPASVMKKMASMDTSEVGLTVITLFELQYGVENSHYREQSQSALDHFLEPIQTILPMDEMVAKKAAKLRAELKKKGTPVGAYDLLIAAFALAHEVTLVSNNTREFERVEGLSLANWAK